MVSRQKPRAEFTFSPRNAYIAQCDLYFILAHPVMTLELAWNCILKYCVYTVATACSRSIMRSVVSLYPFTAHLNTADCRRVPLQSAVCAMTITICAIDVYNNPFYHHTPAIKRCIAMSVTLMDAARAIIRLWPHGPRTRARARPERIAIFMCRLFVDARLHFLLASTT